MPCVSTRSQESAPRVAMRKMMRTGTEPNHRSMTVASARSGDPDSRADLTAPRPLEDDLELELLIPADDAVDPEVSIVIPAVNEELCISDFVAWCHEGLRRAGAVGEILIVDSSTDRTPDLALA